MTPLEVVDPPVTPGRYTEMPAAGTQKKAPFQHIELEINTACDLTCFGCDRFSDVTTAPNMTVNQVKCFVEESLDLKWQWERIRILGGEPTLHPHLFEIVELLISYRMFYPKCFIQLLSNGRGKLDKCRHWLIYRGVDPHAEGKEPGVTPPWFNNTRISPVDRDPNVGPLPPCGIFGARGCGIGLTRHGYFLDGAGASIARILGYDIGKMGLREVTWEAMQEQAKVLCRVCGHWNPDSGALVTQRVSETGEVTGKFWTEALEKYRQQRPKMSLIYV